MLLVGAGEVGAKHLHALAGIGNRARLVGVADPAPSAAVPHGVPLLEDWRTALDQLAPNLVIVATPPGVALKIARAASETGARVLVEKPATLHAQDLALPQPCDRRIFVAFQPHFAPGLPGLLANTPAIRQATVLLTCRRDRAYYRDWRTRWETCGGVLHQQAIHGLALALRLIPAETITACTATVRHDRRWAESEDEVTALVEFAGGQRIQIEAQVDSETDAPKHHVRLDLHHGAPLRVRGRNLEAGLGEEAGAPNHLVLRQAMYEALLNTRRVSRPHPSLFPLAKLRRTLQVIDHVYATAHATNTVPSTPRSKKARR